MKMNIKKRLICEMISLFYFLNISSFSFGLRPSSHKFPLLEKEGKFFKSDHPLLLPEYIFFLFWPQALKP
ncbi:MAG: hypothetical protein A2X06_17380 [Bacteroidetes bacterium GWC2_40_22]|nr:MAG: hypothetical protein A2X06_17380 [Bacteroidetes bacterium GWC2_40_22]